MDRSAIANDPDKNARDKIATKKYRGTYPVVKEEKGATEEQ